MIVIVLDRLPASSLGCYGNFACETPNFDLLAAQGIVFDQCFIDSPAGLKVPAGALTLELTAPSNPPEFDKFRRALRSQTAEALWCHISLETASTSVPDDVSQRLLEHFAQVKQCDAILGQLIEVIADENAQSPLVVVARSGDPLAIRTDHPAWLKSVCEEVTHVPLIMVTEGLSASRCLSLIGTTLVEKFLNHAQPGTPQVFLEKLPAWLITLESSPISWRTVSAKTFRTADWLAVLPASDADGTDFSHIQLFAKPEDRWEQLNVAQQYPAVVEDLRRQATWIH